MSGTIKQAIEKKLIMAFAPQTLEVINESAKHAGHKHHDGESNFDGSGETHFRVKITTSQFEKMSRIERHRAITNLLQDEFENGLHALAIEAHAPEK